MKTNLIVKTGLASAISLALVFTSCRKKETDENETEETAAITSHANDVQTNSANLDDAHTEADNSMNKSRGIAGVQTPVTTTMFWPCDATADTSLMQQGIVTLTFNGSGCGGKIRTGQIKYQIVNYTNGVRWRDASAQLLINFMNYNVTRNGKHMVINGTHSLINITGGLVSDLGPDKPSLTRTVRSNNMNITFDDNTTREWNIAKRRTWDYNSGNLKHTVTGDTTVNALSNVCVWGINRKGNEFTTQISSPVVCLQNCGWGKPVSGIKIHHLLNRTVSVTLGTDASGNITSNSCPDNFKAEWTGKRGRQRQFIGTYN